MVTGIVRVDEKPQANLLVSFYPETGRASTGITNEQGEYELMYLFKTPGAKTGMHRVEITTYYEDEESPEAKSGIEKIDKAYNLQSTLSAEVKPGKNVFNFDVTSKPSRPKRTRS